MSLKNNDPQVAVCTYTIRDGDTIKKLARKLGARSETILAMNGLRTASRIHRGETIYLPVRSRDLANLLSGRHKPRPGDATLTGGM